MNAINLFLLAGTLIIVFAGIGKILSIRKHCN